MARQILPNGYHSKLGSGSSPYISPAKHGQVQDEAQELGMWMQVPNSTHACTSADQVLQQLFDQLDSDRSGFVSRSAVIRELETNPVEARIEQVFLVLLCC